MLRSIGHRCREIPRAVTRAQGRFFAGWLACHPARGFYNRCQTSQPASKLAWAMKPFVPSKGLIYIKGACTRLAKLASQPASLPGPWEPPVPSKGLVYINGSCTPLAKPASQPTSLLLTVPLQYTEGQGLGLQAQGVTQHPYRKRSY